MSSPDVEMVGSQSSASLESVDNKEKPYANGKSAAGSTGGTTNNVLSNNSTTDQINKPSPDNADSGDDNRPEKNKDDRDKEKSSRKSRKRSRDRDRDRKGGHHNRKSRSRDRKKRKSRSRDRDRNKSRRKSRSRRRDRDNNRRSKNRNNKSGDGNDIQDHYENVLSLRDIQADRSTNDRRGGDSHRDHRDRNRSMFQGSISGGFSQHLESHGYPSDNKQNSALRHLPSRENRYSDEHRTTNRSNGHNYDRDRDRSRDDTQHRGSRHEKRDRDGNVMPITSLRDNVMHNANTSRLNIGNILQQTKMLKMERERLSKQQVDYIEMIAFRNPENNRNKNDPTIDKQEYYKCQVGEKLGDNGEFEAVEQLGTGVYSSVFKCKKVGRDRHRNNRDNYRGNNRRYDDWEDDRDFVAVKIIRNVRAMQNQAMREIERMMRMSSEGPRVDRFGSQFLMYLHENKHFRHHDLQAMVFDLMRHDLRKASDRYLKGQSDSAKGFPLSTVALWGIQILYGLRALKRQGIIQADLKPDNVLLTQDNSVAKIADFGAAMDEEKTIRDRNIQPRYYRAPEVFLGQRYDCGIDMWSFGCTLYELAKGKILFTGASDNKMIQKMMDLCGRFPLEMVCHAYCQKKNKELQKEREQNGQSSGSGSVTPAFVVGDYAHEHFDKKTGDFLLHDEEALQNEMGDKSMDQPTKVKLLSEKATKMATAHLRMKDFVKYLELDKCNVNKDQDRNIKGSKEQVSAFSDLLQKCLQLDPKKRVNAEEAVKHEFFSLCLNGERRKEFMGK
ncbi:unnamed protein product [Amoebophrya sp. A120]|nr:unnamed protein product [Amoebophrya sp. A120]|eukprot:GSA120T00020722001.1